MAGKCSYGTVGWLDGVHVHVVAHANDRFC